MSGREIREKDLVSGRVGGWGWEKQGRRKPGGKALAGEEVGRAQASSKFFTLQASRVQQGAVPATSPAPGLFSFFLNLSFPFIPRGLSLGPWEVKTFLSFYFLNK